jgi:hypothetical protein
MIQSFADKYRKHIAHTLFAVFYLQTILLPYSAVASNKGNIDSYYNTSNNRVNKKSVKPTGAANGSIVYNNNTTIAKAGKVNLAAKTNHKTRSPKKEDIGGPASPEASSFKAVGSDNLVSLATGDFSYSIPLLDVGGYPVNLFYSGGITMEQEASWVGLGWNINPGTVSRNMRGVPDDFNGTDLLTQTQNLKPNRTWGGDLGIEVELVGIKVPKIGLGGSLGFSYNNYLGPALEVGSRVSLSISTSKNVEGEKAAPAKLGLTAALGAKLSSRSGLTFSPSLSANSTLSNMHVQGGVGLSTSYNSRTGIKDLNVHSEMSYYAGAVAAKYGKDDKGNDVMTEKAHNPLNLGTSIGSSTISFAKASYVPSLRMPMENVNYSGQIEFGVAFFGVRPGISVLGYYSESKVQDEAKLIKKPLVGYMYSELASKNQNAVMDFNRLNDAEVTPNTPIISAPQYNYDIFSIQGEGTGGSIRAYRGDLGFVRDNVTVSKDKNVSVGIDVGVPFHIGMNVNVIKTPTRVGGWEEANNTLLRSMAFKPKQANSSFENIYFKNPGEATVTSEEVIDRIGRDNLVRFKLGGSGESPRIESRLEQFSKKTSTINGNPISIANKNLVNREKRTQVITILTAADASKIGLEKEIRNYREGANEFDVNTKTIIYDPLPRVDATRKAHHISEINVLEQSGMRYVYGLPVYSLKQKDFTFSVNALPTNPIDNLVGYSPTEPTVESEHMTNKAKLDGYVQSQETPAYATSFLLTGLLSPDYVDVTGDGVTEDDLGGAVKFDYTKAAENHKWRTPRNNSIVESAHFNEGIRTEKKDNKATISYGEREVWYLNAIESKSMVAIFKTDVRKDAKGVQGEMNGKINDTENANKKLTQIDLYTKAEIKSKGYVNAKPIKTVKFEYDYSLCKGSPDNTHADSGKLTLKAVYFSYNGQVRNNKDRYIFNYGNPAYKKDNPNYSYNASDRWGTYKPAKDSTGLDNNPDGLTNADFPYTTSNKSKNDIYASAWSLKKILLPSGGQMEVQYEADDYAYVQDRRACNMVNIYGLGKTTSYTNDNGMYNNGLSSNDNYYMYVKLPQPLTGTNATSIKQEIYAKYLEGISRPGENKLACKIQVNMPKGLEPLTVYPEYDDYGLCTNSGNSITKDYIYIHLVPVDGKSPLAKTAIGFLTENIPGQAFEGYEVEVDGFKAFAEMAGAMLSSLGKAFENVDQSMRSDPPKARTIELSKSFVRLANPVKNKYGGGVRVKGVRVKDNWNKMTGQYNSVYGQDYDYTTTEKTNGIETVISSGVASYEPGIGGEENPFREIVSFSNKMPLASAQYGAIEMPMLEGLYPSAGVVYSKVTVRSIHRKGTHGDSALRSAIGKQVTEFYTARDYPSYSAITPMDVLDYNKNPFFSFFYKEVVDKRTLSQGFLVETNDMHGKMKSQLAYSESDEKTPLSASYHFYKNTGKNGLNDKVDFIDNSISGGAVKQGNMGIDMELMTDVREFSVKSNGFNGQLQVDLYTFALIVIPLPTFFPLKTYVENMYRAVTCTKLINYHAIEDSVIVMDKGSVISTKTIAYDAETGTPIVTKTANEFKDPIYNINYPAYWAYSGMGLAYKNINREFKNVNFDDGKILNPEINQNEVFESGDELYIIKPGAGKPDCVAESPSVTKLWAYDKNKNTTALTVTNKDLVFLDSAGNIFTKSGVDFRIIRSGKRNLLGNSVASATTMANPIVNGVLNVTNASKTVAASAMEFKEKWQTDNGIIKRYSLLNATSGPNLIVNGDFSNQNTGFTSSYTFYPTPYQGGHEGTYTVGTNPHSWNSDLISIGDHTSGTGHMLLVNGAPQPINVWSQTLSVQPNKSYIFSAWTIQTFFQNYPVLQFKINGVQVGANFNVYGVSSWSQFFFTWNSGSSTTATISIADINTIGYGNDFAIDDISFKLATCGVPPSEVLDCVGGYLEKKINPYVKGLIGNYKGFRSLVYYGDRESIPVSPNATRIRTNGYLSNFSMYWNFNGNQNLLPDASNIKWVWNSQSMKYNSKGLELETKDALNIYTAAQYGFNKTQPVALAKNSRYYQMFGEDFEDYSFDERINANGTSSCNKRHINFNGVPNLSVSNTETLGFNAHTGKNFLSVNPNSSAAKELSVINDDIDSYSFISKSDTTKHLNELGGSIIQSTQSIPPQCLAINPNATYLINTTFGNNFNLMNLTTSYGVSSCYNTGAPWSYNRQTQQFIEIAQDDNYIINSFAYQISDFPPYTPTFQIMIYSVATGESIPQNTISTSLSSGGLNVRSVACLKKGIYKIVCICSNFRFTNCQGVCTNANSFDSYTMYIENFSGYSYKSISTNNECISSKPIPATDSMLNSTFNLTPNKKMQFSAWIKEGCSTTPCTKIDYNLSNIEMWANGAAIPGSTIKRTGAIIEGWQKIEGEFTVPANATTAEIHFINSNTAPMYVDDIRIHPFNANMKTYAYDSRTLRLAAELDENNYATFYEYDEEGQLVRVKKETTQGIKTINETRAAKQKTITAIVE